MGGSRAVFCHRISSLTQITYVKGARPTDFLETVVRGNPIDGDRVSLVGISAGASAACDWACYRPNRFAALVALGGGAVPWRQSIATQLPYWFFANANDERFPVSTAQGIVQTINNAGGVAHLTTIPQSGHDVWNAAFRGNFDLLQWLQEKTVAQPLWYKPPGCRVKQWTDDMVKTYASPALTLLGVTMLIVAAKYHWRRQIIKRKDADADEHD